VGIFNWILEVPGYSLLHHSILAFYLGSYFGIFGLLFSLIAKRLNITLALFAAPFIWVFLEYIRSNFFFVALPWGLLAHSQYKNPLFIQVASLSGAYGISFLIVMVNSAFTAFILPWADRLKKNKSGFDYSISKHGRAAVVSLAIALLSLTLFHGYMTVSKPIIGDEIKLSVVQGDIEQVRKWDRKYAKFIMETYASLSRKASEKRPALIIWPETATPRSISTDPRVFVHVNRIVNEAGAHLLLGSAQHRKFRQDISHKKIKYLNSAFLIPPVKLKSLKQRYDKIRLLPFGEYLPLRDILPWSYIKVPDLGTFVSGDKFTVFKHPDFRFAVTICWENIFPDLVRQFVKIGAQAIINITNEAWFGKTAAPYQFLSMSVFRAVENHVFVVRCANTGISCFIDPYGRIVNRVKDENDRDIFIRGVLTDSIIPLESKTFYTRYGDWLSWLSFICTLFFLFFALRRKDKDKPLIFDA